MEKRKKVLFFSGFFDDAMDHRLEKIIRDFPDDKIEMVFVHFNSISNPGFKIQSKFNNLKCIDVKSYKTLNIKKVLNIEKPDIIITLTFMHIIDRIFITLGKIMKIHIIVFQHGNITIEQPNYKKWKVKSISSKFIKYFWFILIYIRSLLPYLNNRKLSFLIHLLKSPNRYIQYYSYFEDYDIVKVVLFGKYYEDFLMSLGFRKGNMFNIGTPMTENGVNELVFNSNQYILYLSDNCALSTLYGWSKEKERKLLQLLEQSGKNTGKRVIYRPHPLQGQSHTNEICSGIDVVISYTDKVANLVKHSFLVVGKVSAALNEAIYQYKPILLLKENDNIRYRFDYATYDIGYQCDFKTIGEVIEKEEEIKVNKEIYDDFIEKFITFYNPEYSRDAYKLIRNLAES